jgi:hypothetical protein
VLYWRATSIGIVGVVAPAEKIEKRMGALPLVLAARLIGTERISVETLIATDTKRGGCSEFLLAKDMPKSRGWFRFSDVAPGNDFLRVTQKSQVAALALTPAP